MSTISVRSSVRFSARFSVRSSFLLLSFLWFLSTALPLVSVEPPANGNQGQLQMTDAQAELLLAAANRALSDSNETPSRAVDAALAFSKVLPFYQQLGDTERLCEIEAAIFWCKKRMNLDDVKRFLASKGGSKTDAELLASADKVVTQQVSAAKVQAYYDRAEQFAKEHPKSYNQIATRWFEVAERFTGTELGRKAHVLSLSAQETVMEQLSAERIANRETIFSRPEPERDEAKLVAMPEPSALRTAVTELRKTHKAEFAKKRPTQRTKVAQRLANEAKDTKLSPEQRLARLREAVGIASALNDYALLLLLSEQEAMTFAGDSVRTRQRAVIATERGAPEASAIGKLLMDPADAPANLAAGRFFCFELGKWEEGIPMLARGGDQELTTIAGMEMVKPDGWMQQVELGDRWHAAGKKSHGERKRAMLARSFHWYSQALPHLSGITKERISQLLNELGDFVAPENFDYGKLTTRQWELLKTKAIEISADKQAQDIGLVLKVGMIVRVVPHPTDRWTMNYSKYHWPNNWSNIFDSNAMGYSDEDNKGRTLMGNEKYCIGTVVTTLEKDEPKKAGEVKGVGRVFIGPYLPGDGSGKGKMRVKVLIIDDE